MPAGVDTWPYAPPGPTPRFRSPSVDFSRISPPQDGTKPVAKLQTGWPSKQVCSGGNEYLFTGASGIESYVYPGLSRTHEFATGGSHTLVVRGAGFYHVVLIGGGGGGKQYASTTGGAGRAGAVTIRWVWLEPGAYSVSAGAAGAGGNGAGMRYGSAGGASSAFGLSAAGGSQSGNWTGYMEPWKGEWVYPPPLNLSLLGTPLAQAHSSAPNATGNHVWTGYGNGGGGGSVSLQFGSAGTSGAVLVTYPVQL